MILNSLFLGGGRGLVWKKIAAVCQMEVTTLVLGTCERMFSCFALTIYILKNTGRQGQGGGWLVSSWQDGPKGQDYQRWTIFTILFVRENLPRDPPRLRFGIESYRMRMKSS